MIVMIAMAGRMTVTLSILTVVILGPMSTSASKLNVPRVLLPYSDTPPSFSLRSEAGCYRWSNTRPDLVKVNVDKNDACNDAVVSDHLEFQKQMRLCMYLYSRIFKQS